MWGKPRNGKSRPANGRAKKREREREREVEKRRKRRQDAGCMCSQNVLAKALTAVPYTHNALYGNVAEGKEREEEWDA